MIIFFFLSNFSSNKKKLKEKICFHKLRVGKEKEKNRIKVMNADVRYVISAYIEKI